MADKTRRERIAEFEARTGVKLKLDDVPFALHEIPL